MGKFWFLCLSLSVQELRLKKNRPGNEAKTFIFANIPLSSHCHAYEIIEVGIYIAPGRMAGYIWDKLVA